MRQLTEEQKEANRRYYLKNRDKLLTAQKEYEYNKYHDNIEKSREYQRKRVASWRARKKIEQERKEQEQQHQNKVIDNIGKSYISVN
jgi:hypothetical protein